MARRKQSFVEDLIEVTSKLPWWVGPDHLHTIWSLPEGDANCPLRWSLIKAEE